MMPANRSRGITLTEILISIMIMGVGFVSLATLFPLGMLRLRDAQRYSRSGTLAESATGDLEGRNLLSKPSFLNSAVSPWYTLAAYTSWPYDPWIQDTPSYGTDPITGGATGGVYRGNGSYDPNLYNKAPHNVKPPNNFLPGPGLPVAYDPLWRYQTGIYPGEPNAEARFACGLGFIRPDPGGGGTNIPSAHGLQRITNFNPFALATWVKSSSNYVPDIFVSPEDAVLQSATDAGQGANGVSPIVPEMIGPDLTLPTISKTGMWTFQNDWKYTWMFTGQQSDCTNGTVFTGDIVVFENRPFGIDKTAPTYFATGGGNNGVVEGETVVEAIFGYTNDVTQFPTGGTNGYGAAANRAVLIRWSAAMPDPEIRVGSWIADVTYERVATVAFNRQYTSPAIGSKDQGGIARAYFPYQRCHWYQVGKRTQAGPAVNTFAGDAPATAGGMREMTVWVNTPLRAFTLLTAGGVPYHVNAALVSPFVVNVFPRTIYTR
jgi:hypothetical protein